MPATRLVREEECLPGEEIEPDEVSQPAVVPDEDPAPYRQLVVPACCRKGRLSDRNAANLSEPPRLEVQKDDLAVLRIEVPRNRTAAEPGAFGPETRRNGTPVLASTSVSEWIANLRWTRGPTTVRGRRLTVGALGTVAALVAGVAVLAGPASNDRGGLYLLEQNWNGGAVR
jgi:hypothetical protein